jgi:hypothetical protein
VVSREYKGAKTGFFFFFFFFYLGGGGI